MVLLVSVERVSLLIKESCSRRHVVLVRLYVLELSYKLKELTVKRLSVDESKGMREHV